VLFRSIPLPVDPLLPAFFVVVGKAVE